MNFFRAYGYVSVVSWLMIVTDRLQSNAHSVNALRVFTLLNYEGTEYHQ